MLLGMWNWKEAVLALTHRTLQSCLTGPPPSELLSGISSLTWVLPDRFSESEFALEAAHTAINLLSTFHESILAEGSAPGAARSGAARLTTALAAMQQVQVLIEVAGLWRERKHGGNRYDELAAFEAVKCVGAGLWMGGLWQ